MKFNNFVILFVAATISVSVSFASAHGDGKKSDKTNHACCGEKAGAKKASMEDDTSAKKAVAKASSDGEKASLTQNKASNPDVTKTGGEAQEMDCCRDAMAEKAKTKPTELKDTK